MHGLKRERGILFVISGPSGVGKNSVLTQLLKEVPGLCYSVSATTRQARKGEVDGVNYFFMTREQFLEKVETGDFLEHEEYVGNLYGTPRGYIEKELSEGCDIAMDIECRGAAQIKRMMPEAVLIFLTPPSMEELKARLLARSTDSQEAIEKRVKKAEVEMGEIYTYDYYVMNDDLRTAVEDIKKIIGAERLKVSRLKRPSVTK
ncbi:MAG TPA: guanylate kinase [Bacillota bacterium]|nr:guanylate kinase [Bacillota bacterium]HOH11052.1 guanylate kinase [Bacillota bacterium]HOY89441.1 guanylate kinase [Bacillota bacterium]HPI01386.1 guanylate kinase [Bacillota bacterium]